MNTPQQFPENVRRPRSHSFRSHLRYLSKIFLAPKSSKEMEAFLQDFLTPGEIKQLVERWYIGDLVVKGSSQRQIKEKLRVSISKVSRGASVVQYGNGGFRRAWERLHKLRPSSGV